MAMRQDGAREGALPAVSRGREVWRRRGLPFLDDGRKSGGSRTARKRREPPDRALTRE